MAISRVTPRARQGTTGISEETNVTAGNGVVLFPPDRIAAVTVAVHIPAGKTGTYKIETSCNRPETIGDNGAGGYWDNPYGAGVTLSEDAVLMIANAVTAIRVTVTATNAADGLNVCFVG